MDEASDWTRDTRLVRAFRPGPDAGGAAEELRPATVPAAAHQRGFYLMDEPDAPLSFVSCLSLVTLLHELAGGGSQVIVATHSPVLAAVPGATVLELGDWGIRPARWEDLEIVQSWRLFLGNPGRYMRYLLADEDEEDEEA